MSESKFMTNISENINFIKEQAAADLINFMMADNDLKLEREKIQKIARVLQSSIEASFSKSSNNLSKIYQEMKK